MRKNNPDRWHFTRQTNANGYTYIYAYQTAWDPVKKRSRRVSKKYVGRLHEDGHVDVSPKFAEVMPAYAQGEFFYGADKTLVDRATYLADFPAQPGPRPETDEEPENESQIKELGITWAAEQLAEELGIKEDLTACFGSKLGQDLLNLAIFMLDEGGPMDSFEDWRQETWLSSSRRLSSQRISEILAQVTRADFDKYFRRRHDWRLDQSKAEKKRLSYALDNTSISTYSETIEDAEWGKAKQNPELRQINYTFVCDQETGDIVFVHTYEGSVNDMTALQEILYRMMNAGLDLKEVVLVTDRGYSSIRNIQKMLNLEIGFIQGVRIVEDSLKREFDKYRESLGNIAFYNPALAAYSRSTSELWTEDCEYGRLTLNLNLHLYRFPGKDEEERIGLVAKAEEILALKQANLVVPSALWESGRRYVKEVNENGKKTWVCDYKAIEEACRYRGLFAIRSNVEPDPLEALRIYRLRNVVEIDFNQYKNWLDGARVRSTEATYLGKMFVTTVGATLRIMMLNRLRKSKNFDLSEPCKSLCEVMRKLRRLRAEKRTNANAWVSRTLTKKQRDYFALLGVQTPPRVLR